jgi:hypothetical protein
MIVCSPINYTAEKLLGRSPSINTAKVKRKPYTKKWTDLFTFLPKNALEAFSLLYNSDTIFSILTLHFIHWTSSACGLVEFGVQRSLHLRNRLLDQIYKKIRLIRSLIKFIFRYQDLVEIYSVFAEKIISDGFSYSENV